MASCAASADLIASIRREISPLEAIARSGFSGSPGLGEKSSSTESNPLASRFGRERQVRFELRLPETKIAQIAGGCLRQVSAPLLLAICAALRRARCTFAREPFRFRWPAVPVPRRVLRFCASARPRVRQTRSLRRSSRRICVSRFRKAKRVVRARRAGRIEIEFLRVIDEGARNFGQLDHRGLRAPATNCAMAVIDFLQFAQEPLRFGQLRENGIVGFGETLRETAPASSISRLLLLASL